MRREFEKMFHSTGLISTFALVTLFAFTSALSRPTSNDSDQKLIASVYQALGFQEKSPVTNTDLQTSAYKVDPTVVTLEDELNTFTSDFHDENKQSSEPSYFQTTTTEGIPHSTPQENSDALLEEINKFMQQPDLEDVVKEKSEDISLTNKAGSDSNVDNLASTSEKTSNTQPSKVSLGVSTPSWSSKPSPSTPKVSTTESPLDENDVYKNDDAVEVTSAQEKNSKLIDTKIILIIGASAAGLLVVLMVVILFYLSRPKSPKSKGMYLNSDLNRWDPHLLRPSQKSIDSFIFGTPIPSVSEMIKAQDDVEIVIKGTTY